MTTAVQVLANGLLYGSVLSLVSVGISLVFGVMNVLNFAQGAMVAIGVYLGYFVVGQAGWPLIVAVPLGVLAGLALGVLAQRVALYRISSVEPLRPLLATFGLGLLVVGLLGALFTTDIRAYEGPLRGSLNLGGVKLPTQSVALGLAGLAIVGVIYYVVYHSRFGLGLRATTQHREAAASCGVNLDKMDAIAFGLGTAIAVGGGVLLSIRYPAYPTIGDAWLLQGLVAAIIGGLRSILGGVVGAMVVGVVFTALTYVTGNSQVASLLIYVTLGLLILVRGGGVLKQA
jgi:Branched-chain amino acid ABC-type transport system, permease components